MSVVPRMSHGILSLAIETKEDLYKLARNSFEGSLTNEEIKAKKIAELDSFYRENK